jgi:hypothetical protein
MKETTTNKALSLKTLTKSTVWDVQENDIFRMLDASDKEGELKENLRHIADIVRSAFMIEEVKDDNKLLQEKYTKQGYKVGTFKVDENAKVTWAIKKRPITRVTDLTYENIRHISAAKLMEVIDRNFGGGWDSLSQSIQDIIQSGFDVSTTTLPKDRLHNPGGMYEKKVADGFEVLEIPKGLWVEAIFAKEKQIIERPCTRFGVDEDEEIDIPNEEDEDLPEIEDHYNDTDEDDYYDEDKLTEESYRTTFDETPEDLDLDAVEVADDSEY